MHRRTFVASGLASVILVSSPRVARAFGCLGPRDPQVVVMPTVDVPSGEGFLATLLPFTERSLGPAGLGRSNAAMFEIGARLVREGHRDIALRVDAIGPSAARFLPTSAPAPGPWRVVTRHREVELTFGATPVAPLAFTPTLTSVTTITTDADGRAAATGAFRTTARLTTPVGMPTWQGIVAYQAMSATTELAMATHALNGTSDTQIVYADPSRCAFSSPNQSALIRGSLVRVALYDLFGRVSARSNQVRVGE